LEASAWILCLISYEQYLSVRIQHWRNIYFKAKRAYITVTCLVGFFMALNFNIFFTFGFVVDYPIEVSFNQTNSSMNMNASVVFVKKVLCYGDPQFPWTMWMYNIGPLHVFSCSVFYSKPSECAALKPFVQNEKSAYS
jgi:hypothetical protein